MWRTNCRRRGILMSKEDEQSITRSFREGFMEPLKEMAERFKKEGDLREKTQEARYELTQKRLDIIDKSLERILKIVEEKN